MILQYFIKKENTEKIIAEKIYKSIIKKSNYFMNENTFITKKNYNTSFEIVSIFMIFYIKLNIFYKQNNYKLINEYIISIFVSDLDNSLREKGIGDISIGKYVKSYVKKFYFRLSKFPNNIKEDLFLQYLNLFDLIDKKDNLKATQKFIEIYKELENSYIVGK